MAACRRVLVQRLVRALVVELLPKAVEPALLGREIGGGRTVDLRKEAVADRVFPRGAIGRD